MRVWSKGARRAAVLVAAAALLGACGQPDGPKPTVGSGSTGTDTAGELAFAAADSVAADDLPADAAGTGDAMDELPAPADADAQPDDAAVADTPAKPACQNDDDCGSNGGNCIAGQCFFHTACQSDKQCQPQGQVCNVAAGECVPCMADADCPKPMQCKAHACLPPPAACASTKDCAQGMVCSKSAGACVFCVATADCGAGQSCVDTVCVPQVCKPGQSKCQADDTALVCKADGTGWDALPCGPGKICAADQCQATVCAAGKLDCQGTKVVQCSADGTSATPVKECAAFGQLCNLGQCESAKVCAAGSAGCKEGILEVCNALGTGYTKIACPSGQVCVGQACIEQNCKPGEGKCDGDLLLQCNPLGLQFTAAKNCKDGGQICKFGICGMACVAGAVTASKSYSPAGGAAANLVAISGTADGGWALGGAQDGGKPWLVRTDSAGIKLWDKEFAWNNGYLAATAKGPNGGVWAAGGYTDKASNVGCAMVALASSEGTTVSENPICEPPANPPVSLAAESMAVRADGGLYLAGRRGVGASAAGDDFWVARLDAAGKPKWQKSTGAALADRVQDCAVLGDGSLVAVGYSSAAQAGSGETPSAMLVRYDENGTLLWTKLVPNYVASRAAGVAATKAGSLWVVGQGQAKDNSLSQSWLAEFAPDGTLKWQTLIGNVFAAQLVDIAPQSDGTFAILQALSAGSANVLHVDGKGNILHTASLGAGKDAVGQHLAANDGLDLAATTSSLLALKQPGKAFLLCGW